MQSYTLEITNNTDSLLFKALKMKFNSFVMACVTFFIWQEVKLVSVSVYLFNYLLNSNYNNFKAWIVVRIKKKYKIRFFVLNLSVRIKKYKMSDYYQHVYLFISCTKSSKSFLEHLSGF